MAPKRGRPRKDNSDPTPNKKPRLTRAAATVLPSATSSPPGKGEPKISAAGSHDKVEAFLDNSREISDSDEEGQKIRNKQATDNIDSVYDYFCSDEEPDLAHQSSKQATKGAVSNSQRRSTVTKAAKQTGTNTGSKTTSPVARRGRPPNITRDTRIKKISHDDEQAEVSESGGDNNEEGPDSEDVLNTPSAVRFSKKKGALFQKSNGAAPKLKGILTPSKRLSERNAKVVAFDEPSRKNEEMFFADLPNKSVKSKSTSQTRPYGKENRPMEVAHLSESEISDDEEVCAICSRPESKPPNQILFCDSCDMAVHQKCYGVLRIPKADWFCKDCSQDSSKVAAETKAVVETLLEAPETVPNIPNFEQHLRSLQRVLLDRCTGKRRIKLCGQDEAYEKTIQLVEQTVMAGEGNSMLVIGARGCGKTTLVDSVLLEVGLQHKDEFHIVRLNGFIHTDDKLALKDIWRQLGKEMDVEDDLIGKTTNYADTLASLLALLSHPSEIANSQEGVTSKSVVFVIDEFDLFATHARQTLLYNLFDIAQARKAPIAVLGLTNKMDVVESLEKRVKSRFSHRYVYMSLPKTFREYWEICKQGLVVDDEDAKAEGLDISLNGFAQFFDFWTQKIDSLYKDQAFKDHIEYYYYSSKSAPAFLSSCVLPLASLSPTDVTLRLSAAQGAVFSTDPPDSKLHLLEALSDLDLSLLISAARLDIVAHTDTVNFAMAYDEYTTLIGRQRVQSSTSGMLALGGGVRVWGRSVAEMAWERLVKLGLLLPTSMGSKHGGLEGRMCKVDVALEEIPVAVKLNTVLARWCKEI